MYNFSKRSLKKLSDCHIDLKRLAIEAIKDSPFDFGITCGYRPPEVQRQLYLQGRGKPGKIITNCDGYLVKSKHNLYPALAFDFGVYIEGELTWDEKYYKEVGEHIVAKAKELGIKITWPIRLSDEITDWPHIQLA